MKNIKQETYQQFTEVFAQDNAARLLDEGYTLTYFADNDVMLAIYRVTPPEATYIPQLGQEVSTWIEMHIGLPFNDSPEVSFKAASLESLLMGLPLDLSRFRALSEENMNKFIDHMLDMIVDRVKHDSYN